MVRSVTDDETLRYVERLVKFLLWSRGGWRLVVALMAGLLASALVLTPKRASRRR
jgi:hypothetical protein